MQSLPNLLDSTLHKPDAIKWKFEDGQTSIHRFFQSFSIVPCISLSLCVLVGGTDFARICLS